MTSLFSIFLSKNSIAFDIGAYGGERTDTFLALGCSRVVAVEAVAEYASGLRKRYVEDGRVVVVGKAAGAQNGMGILKRHRIFWPNGQPMMSACSSMSKEWVADAAECSMPSSDWSEDEPVEIVTLDTLISEYGEPDFIKIDVEGWEQEVLKGLTRPVKALSFEFHTVYKFNWTEEAADRLMSLGSYEFNYSVWNDLELVSPTWLDKEELFSRLRGQVLWGDIYARVKAV